MQPLHYRPSGSTSTSPTNPVPNQKQRIRFQDVDQDSEEEDTPKELPFIASNSQRTLPAQPIRKISPTEGSEPISRLTGRIRRDLSFEDSSTRSRVIICTSKRLPVECSGGSDVSEPSREDALIRRRNQSLRERHEASTSANPPQKPSSQSYEDSFRKK